MAEGPNTGDPSITDTNSDIVWSKDTAPLLYGENIDKDLTPMSPNRKTDDMSKEPGNTREA